MFRFFDEQEYTKNQDQNHGKLALGTKSSPIPTLRVPQNINLDDIIRPVDPAEMSYHPQSNLFCSANNVPTKLPLRPNILSKSAGDVPTTSPTIQRIVGFKNPTISCVLDNAKPIGQKNIRTSRDAEALVTKPVVLHYEEQSQSPSKDSSNNSYKDSSTSMDENNFVPSNSSPFEEQPNNTFYFENSDLNQMKENQCAGETSKNTDELHWVEREDPAWDYY